MSAKILQPPLYEEIEGPVIFLAGPIQGASDWQKEAIRILHSFNPNICIANPRREYLDGMFVYEKQVDWETHYLNRAAKNGVILFWLAKEFAHACDRAYAQTTRFEIAEWKAKYEQSKFSLVIGIEEGFTGGRYVKHRVGKDCPEVKILNNLEETCRTALKYI